MKLLKLEVRNFKAISAFDFEPGGKNASIYGHNYTGKTTVFDALMWLLTDKNSLGESQFGIKPIKGLKQGAETEVTAEFDVDGDSVTLKKTFKEIWTKKRGSATAEFSGHTSDFFVNGVPVRLKGFTEKIEQIAPANLFRLLTDPKAFNALKTDAKRAMLIEVCGDVSNEDVIKSDSDFERIPGMIGKKTPEEYRLELQYQKKGVNEKLKAVPTRIDELQRSLPDEESTPEDVLRASVDNLNSRLSVKRNELSMVESGGAVGQKKAEKLQVENEIAEIEIVLRRSARVAIEQKESIVRFCKDAVADLQKKFDAKDKDIAATVRAIDINVLLLDKAKTAWTTEKEIKFEYAGPSEPCSRCGAHPEYQIKLSEESALADFNRNRAETLKAIDEKGRALCLEIKNLKAEKAKLQKEIDAISIKAAGLVKDLEAAEKALAAEKEKSKYPVVTDPDHKRLMNKRDEISAELSLLESGSKQDTSGIYADIETLEKELQAVNNAIATIAAEKKTRTRITELEKEEKQLAAEFERIEGDLMLLEAFTRAKCDMLTDRINRQFKYTTFILFEEQINGGIKDVCNAVWTSGAQWQGLSRSEKNYCGIDIINTLSRHYGITMPIFLDDAEGTLDDIETDSQLIRLVASMGVKKLTVEIDQ